MKYTSDMGFGEWVQGIENRIQNTIPFLMFRVYVTHSQRYGYR